MKQLPDFIALGSPEFPQRAAALSEQDNSPAAPWLDGLRDDPWAFLSRVHGDFAVAVRYPDGRAVLAVDRFAICSLCWSVVDGQLRYATRADQLSSASTPIDPQAIYDYLFAHAISSPRTVFRGVFRLPPGHALVFDRGQITVRPYWTPKFDEDRSPSFGDLREQFLQLLEQAVARGLDGGRPACFLSGGTDSSTVAGMIGRAAGVPAHTYSIGFKADGYDEMEYARIAARHFKAVHHEYYLSPEDLVRSIADVAVSCDQPFGNSSVLPAYYCALRAREDGVSRLLAGDGGDELFGGNTRYAKQRVFGWYAQIPAPVRKGVLEPMFERSAVGQLPLLRKGKSYIEQAKVAMPDRLNMYNLLLRLGVADVLTPEFRAQVDEEAPARQQREVWAAAAARSEVNRTLAFDWRYTLAESDLPKVCTSSALAGVSVAFPFLDTHLLDFSLGLPPAYKLRGLKLRWFFKEALRGFLPEAIITKKKHGFGLPFGVWAVRHEPLKRLASDSLHSLGGRGIVKTAFIRDLLEHRLTEHPGYYGEMVWVLMMLEQWLRGHAPDHRL